MIHQTAIIDDGAIIGKDTNIWHWSHISSGAIIGEKCNLGQNVYVGPNVQIGNFVKVQNNVSIYEGLIIEDNVFCGPSVVFTNVINPRSGIDRSKEFKRTIVSHGASLGANSTIICGTKIGKFAFVGAGSVITKDVKDFSLVYGVPARHHGWISEHGIKMDFKESNIFVCPIIGDKYELIDNKVIKIN